MTKISVSTKKPQRVLVTGGAGFIGSHLCEELIQRGYEVTCLDNFSTGSRANLEHLPAVTIIKGDANDFQTWQDLAGTTFDILFHYAATVGVRRTEENPDLVLQDAQGINHVAAFARAGGAGRIVFASSSEVYGDPKKLPEDEEDGYTAWTPYTTVKLYGEHVFKALWQQQGIPTVSLRFFNVYGPRQRGTDYGFVVGNFIQQVLRGDEPTVFGTGSQTRDFVYITDNVRLALAASNCPEIYGQVLNVGTGQETTVLELAQHVITVAGRADSLKPTFVAARPVEIKRRCASTAKMSQLVGDTCQISLSEGLRDTLNWYRDGQASDIPAVPAQSLQSATV